jgi:hypothetical protein
MSQGLIKVLRGMQHVRGDYQVVATLLEGRGLRNGVLCDVTNSKIHEPGVLAESGAGCAEKSWGYVGVVIRRPLHDALWVSAHGLEEPPDDAICPGTDIEDLHGRAIEAQDVHDFVIRLCVVVACEHSLLVTVCQPLAEHDVQGDRLSGQMSMRAGQGSKEEVLGARRHDLVDQLI